MLNQSTALRTEVGTRAFSAPEATPDDYEETFQYTNAVDMWSLGCVIYNVLAHSLPYQNNHAKRFPFPAQPLKDRVSDQGINLLECLLRVDPSTRWTAQKAVKHPWLETFTEASSAAMKDATEDASPVARPERPSDSQNKLYRPDDEVEMPTVVSNTEKTCPKLSVQTERPIKQLTSQSLEHREKNGQIDSKSNNDRPGTTASKMLTSSSGYGVSDTFGDLETETLKSYKAGYPKLKDASRGLHGGNMIETPIVSPVTPAIVSKSPDIGLGTSYSSSKMVEEGATQGEPLAEIYRSALTVRRRQGSEEQGTEQMELVTTLWDLYRQGGHPEHNEIARALELIRQGVDLETRCRGKMALQLVWLLAMLITEVNLFQSCMNCSREVQM